jgi:hypothetical protein
MKYQKDADIFLSDIRGLENYSRFEIKMIVLNHIKDILEKPNDICDLYEVRLLSKTENNNNVLEFCFEYYGDIDIDNLIEQFGDFEIDGIKVKLNPEQEI